MFCIDIEGKYITAWSQSALGRVWQLAGLNTWLQVFQAGAAFIGFDHANPCPIMDFSISDFVFEIKLNNFWML